MGMGQEIKDFINGYGAGKRVQQGDATAEYRKLAGQRLQQQIDIGNDPRMKDLSIKRLQAQVNYFNARAARSGRGPDATLTQGRALTNQLRTIQIDQALHPEKYAPKVPGAADDAPSFAAPSMGPRSALDVNSNVAQNDAGSYDDTSDNSNDTSDPTMYSATGGPVTRKGYASGGEVDDEPVEAPEETADESDISPQDAQMQDAQDSAEDGDGADSEPDDDTPASALPVRGAAPAKGAKDAKPVDYSNEAGHDAALAGVNFSARATGHIPDSALTTNMSARSYGSMKHLSGHGAMDRDDFNAVADKVDPDHTLPEAQRNMATLATKYTWDLKHKGPAEADAGAASMTQYMRMTSDRYKAIAAAAAHHGDLDGTMENMVRSYANIPTGSDLKLDKTPDGHVNWSITDDATGKQVQGGLMTPDELLGWATKGGMPSFDSLLASSASGRAELAAKAKGEAAAAKATAAANSMKPSDRKITSEGIDNAASTLTDADVPKDQLGELKSTAFQMHRANPTLDANDALTATRMMTTVNADNVNDPSKAFTILSKPGDPAMKVRLGNGQAVTIPPELVPRLQIARAANAKAFLEKQASAAKVGKAVGAATTAGINLVTSPGGNREPTPQDIDAARQRMRAMRQGYTGALPVGQ